MAVLSSCKQVLPVLEETIGNHVSRGMVVDSGTSRTSGQRNCYVDVSPSPQKGYIRFSVEFNEVHAPDDLSMVFRALMVHSDGSMDELGRQRMPDKPNRYMMAERINQFMDDFQIRDWIEYIIDENRSPQKGDYTMSKVDRLKNKIIEEKADPRSVLMNQNSLPNQLTEQALVEPGEVIETTKNELSKILNDGRMDISRKQSSPMGAESEQCKYLIKADGGQVFVVLAEINGADLELDLSVSFTSFKRAEENVVAEESGIVINEQDVEEILLNLCDEVMAEYDQRRSELVSPVEMALEDLANDRASRTYSDLDMHESAILTELTNDQYNQVFDSLYIIAEFGDWTAVNGSLVGVEIDETPDLSGHTELGLGGRVPSEEMEVSNRFVLDRVMDEEGFSKEDPEYQMAVDILEDRFHSDGQVSYRTVSGYYNIYIPSTILD